MIAQACRAISGGPNLPRLEPGYLDTDPATGAPVLKWTARIRNKSAVADCPEDALTDLLTLLLNTEEAV